MPVTVDLAKNAGGAWIGSLSIPTSSSIDVPLSAIDVQGDAVKFTTNLPEKTSFDGKVSSDGGTLSGTVSNIDGSVAFQLARCRRRAPPCRRRSKARGKGPSTRRGRSGTSA
jgi:hypothetical protein